ncbi:hypothetical protein [Streptomyces fumanus]|nr:hypothetical protein [Streptomyces fumanus]
MAGRHGGRGPADRVPLESLLATALRADAAGREDRALAAFRDARDSGTHQAARTRRRDDWRPRRPARRITLSVLAAGLALGGVAYAAIDAGRPAPGDTDRHRDRPPAATTPPPPARPTPEAPAPTSADPTRTSAPADPDRPAPAPDPEADCRAYERLPDPARNATAWRRLVAAAGGEDEVAAYCARRLTTPPTARPAPPDRPADPGRPTRTHPGNGSAQSANKGGSKGGKQ